MIKMKNINLKFKGRVIFSGLDLNIENPGVYGFAGPNGTGKSVLFKLISGIYRPDHGEVYIRGQRLGKNGLDFAPNLGIMVNDPGFVGIYPGFKNLKFLAEIQGKIKDEDIKKWMRYLDLNPEDKTLTKNYSLGMKQKLGIIQAVMENQDIVILDEPFNALDKKSAATVKELISTLKSQNKIVLLTSHNDSYLEEVCDKIYHLEDYKLI